jgi:hypothetical protein
MTVARANLRSVDRGGNTSLLIRQTAANTPNAYSGCTYTYLGSTGTLRLDIPLGCDWLLTVATVPFGTITLAACTTGTLTTGPLAGCIFTLSAQTVPVDATSSIFGQFTTFITFTTNVAYTTNGRCAGIRSGTFLLEEGLGFSGMVLSGP